jgi:hypothetical protein
VYGDSFKEKHPAFMAWFLCEGIQWCLNELPDVEQVLAPSKQVNDIKNQLGKFMPAE